MSFITANMQWLGRPWIICCAFVHASPAVVFLLPLCGSIGVCCITRWLYLLHIFQPTFACVSCIFRPTFPLRGKMLRTPRGECRLWRRRCGGGVPLILLNFGLATANAVLYVTLLFRGERSRLRRSLHPRLLSAAPTGLKSGVLASRLRMAVCGRGPRATAGLRWHPQPPCTIQR